MEPRRGEEGIELPADTWIPTGISLEALKSEDCVRCMPALGVEECRSMVPLDDGQGSAGFQDLSQRLEGNQGGLEVFENKKDEDMVE